MTAGFHPEHSTRRQTAASLRPDSSETVQEGCFLSQFPHIVFMYVYMGTHIYSIKFGGNRTRTSMTVMFSHDHQLESPRMQTSASLKEFFIYISLKRRFLI